MNTQLTKMLMNKKNNRRAIKINFLSTKQQYTKHLKRVTDLFIEVLDKGVVFLCEGCEVKGMTRFSRKTIKGNNNSIPSSFH